MADWAKLMVVAAAKDSARSTKEQRWLELLRSEIRERDMMRRWGENSLFAETAEEKKALARKSTLKAKDTYLRMLRSRSNDGSPNYLCWALETVLHIGDRITAPAYAKDFGQRPNRGMS